MALPMIPLSSPLLIRGLERSLSSLPPPVVPSSDVATGRNETVSAVSNLSGKKGEENSLKTYLFSVQVFVDGELLHDDGDTLKLAQFNYTLQEERLAQKLASWRGNRRGELIKTGSSCCLSSNKKNGNMTIEVFSRDDWAKVERCLASFFDDRIRKNVVVKWLIHWAFHRREESVASPVAAEGEDREPIAGITEIQAGAKDAEGAVAARPKVS